LVEDHILGCKKNPFLKNAIYLLAIEGNLAHEAGNIFNGIKKLSNVHPICTGQVDKVGIRTDQYNKPKYAMAARHHVAHGTVQILNKIVCSNRYMKTDSGGIIPPNDRPRIVLEKLKTQLSKYREVEFLNNRADGKKSVKISGVLDRNGKIDRSSNDDLAFAFTFACGVIDLLRARKLEFVSEDWLPENY
jgi:hypothetical protein